jgi:ParB-like chromosome segregation protein Spo0J
MIELKNLIKDKFQQSEDKFEFINQLKELIYEISPEKENPVERVLWVPKEMVVANNYNPNSVAEKEMKLLYTSVREDGYTQPIVTIWDDNLRKYVIVDGFHRNLILRKYKDIDERCSGRLPIVVIDKSIDNRMASTVRHNRARGSHSVDGMVNILYSMLKDGCSEKEICEKLGLEEKELVKMKYITGFAKVFKNYKYSQAIDAIVDVNPLIEEHNEDED